MTIQQEAPPVAWQDVCRIADLTPERGAAALVEGHPVALFRLDDDDVVAIDDVDPFWGVPVLSRGLVGFLAGRDTVASPLLKQRFDLRTGVCIDDPSVAVATWPVRILAGRVEVGRAPSTAGP
jgi:nitrite reductase (NADH) small subunit